MTRLTDYAIIVMARIAAEPDSDLYSAASLATATRLPLPTVTKILKLLGQANVLNAQRGSRGGYKLARPAGEISVADIINALEGPIRIAGCVDMSPGVCKLEPICPTKNIWQRINRTLQDALEKITIEEVCTHQPSRPDAGPGITA